MIIILIVIIIFSFYLGGEWKKTQINTHFKVMKLAIKELEKYEQMWEEFRKKYAEEYIVFEGGDLVEDVMKEFEQKYLTLVNSNVSHG